jgi:putative copper export protein
MSAPEWMVRLLTLTALTLLTGVAGFELLAMRGQGAAALRARAAPAGLRLARAALALLALSFGLEGIARWPAGALAAREVGLFTAQIILIATLLPALGRRPALTLGGCALLLLTRSLGSRSAGLAEWVLPVAADWLHLTAAAFWLGGVAYLALVLVPLALRHGLIGELGAAVERFSPLAVAAVAVIGLTGLMQSAGFLGGYDDLVSSAYGQALLAKSVGFIALIALGAFHQFAIGPRLRLWRARAARAEDAARRFRLSLAVEAALGLGALAAAAAMTLLPLPAGAP